jgi:hypothetical protein
MDSDIDFGSAGVPPAIFQVAIHHKRAGETPALPHLRALFLARHGRQIQNPW